MFYYSATPPSVVQLLVRIGAVSLRCRVRNPARDASVDDFNSFKEVNAQRIYNPGKTNAKVKQSKHLRLLSINDMVNIYLCK